MGKEESLQRTKAHIESNVAAKLFLLGIFWTSPAGESSSAEWCRYTSYIISDAVADLVVSKTRLFLKGQTAS